jgi:hypothetical protein
MTFNMILFTVTIKSNKLDKFDYDSIRQAEDEILDRKTNIINKFY